MKSETDKITILIADDDKATLNVLVYVLGQDYNVITANNGKSALKAAAEHRPDLILLDIIMDDMHGFDVIRALKTNAELLQIPVIFITGLTSPDNEELGLVLGAVDYIHKPFSRAVLKARVATQVKLIRQLRRMESFGLIDTLTELPNRRSFDNALELDWARALRNKSTLSLLVIDIDHFKTVNDAFGHLHGDVVLCKLARLLAATIMRATDFVYRWAGEEFAVILPDTNENGALKVAESIRTAVEAANFNSVYGGEDDKSSLTVSIGVAAMSPASESEGVNALSLIHNADQALFEAKRTGRNKVCVFR